MDSPLTGTDFKVTSHLVLSRLQHISTLGLALGRLLLILELSLGQIDRRKWNIIIKLEV